MTTIQFYTKEQLNKMTKPQLVAEHIRFQGGYKELECEFNDTKFRYDKAVKENRKKDAQIESLKGMMRVFISRKYGRKSEKMKNSGELLVPESVFEENPELFAMLGYKTYSENSDEGASKGNGQDSSGNASGNGKSEGASGKQGNGKGNGKGNNNGSAAGSSGTDKGKDSDGKTSPSDPNPGNSGKGGKDSGHKPVQRVRGFKNLYLPLDARCVYEIDGFRYTEEQLKKVYNLTDDDLVYLENTADINTTIDVIPAVYLKTIHIRPRLRSGDRTFYATQSGSIFDNSVCSSSLMAHLYTLKLGLGLPFARTSRYLKLNDVKIKRDVMSTWFIESSKRYLKPVCRRLHRLLLKRHVIQGDETYVTVTSSDKSNCYFWMIRTSELDTNGPDIILFVFDESRKKSVIENLLKDYQGAFMTDGYICYKQLEKDVNGIISCLCWSHSRRLYCDCIRALPSFDSLSDDVKCAVPAWKVLQLISAIYKEEKAVRLAKDKETRQKIREERIRPLVNQYFQTIKDMKADPSIYIPGGLLAKAIDYSLNGEDRFRRFLEDADIPLDNSASERCMIPVSIGRNGWKSIDSIRGAEACAIAYSVYETAVAAGANPEIYFQYLFELMPQICEDHKDELADEKNELAFLDCMMPWSKEYKAYEKQFCRKYRDIIADALTFDNIMHESQIDTTYVARIIRNPRNNLGDLTPYLKDLDKDSELHPEFYKGLVRGAILPLKPKPELYLTLANQTSAEAGTFGTDPSAAASVPAPEDRKASPGETMPNGGASSPGSCGSPPDTGVSAGNQQGAPPGPARASTADRADPVPMSHAS